MGTKTRSMGKPADARGGASGRRQRNRPAGQLRGLLEPYGRGGLSQRRCRAAFRGARHAFFGQHIWSLALRQSGWNNSRQQRHLRGLVLFIALPQRGCIMPATATPATTLQ